MKHNLHKIGVNASIIICAIIPLFTASAGQITHIVEFDTSSVQINDKIGEDMEIYSAIDWPGLSVSDQVAEPELPLQYITLLIPTLTTDLKVEVINFKREHTLSLDHLIYPVQEPVTTGFDSIPLFQKADGQRYVQNEQSPKAWIVDENMLEGYKHTVTIAVCPTLYSTSSSTLTLLSNMEIELSYRECSEQEINFNVNFDILPSKYFDITSLIENPEKIYNINKSKISTSEGYVENHYVIIAPEYLLDTLKDLVVWKSQKGYEVQIESIENIINNPKYSADGTLGREDDAAALRAYLANYYRLIHGHYFCLLVGDYKTNMPFRRARNLNNGSQPSTKAYTPTDAYFENVTDNWELIWENSNNQFIIKETEYFCPQISIGRLLCHTEEQVDDYLKKLFLYESNPGRGNSEYLDTMFFFEQDADSSMIGEANKVLSDFNVIPNIVVYQDQRRADPPVYWPTGKDVISAIRHSGISSWHGHGSPVITGVMAGRGSWSGNWKFITAREEYSSYDLTCNGKIELNKEIGDGLNTLHNDDFPSVAYSISCSNVPYDIYDEGDNHFDIPYNMGTSFTVGGSYGGPAFLGNTRYGYVRLSAEMESFFFEKVSHNAKIGIAENYSKIMYPNKHLKHTHQLIGDPEFNIWLGKPSKLDLELSSSFELIGNNLPNSNIFISYGKSEVYGYQPMENKFSLLDYSKLNQPISPIFMYGVWKNGFLPELNLITTSGNSYNQNISFVVRKAILGTGNSEDNNCYYICGDSNLKVRAIDHIETKSGFTISDSAIVDLQCDKNISIYGAKIVDNGCMMVRGETVSIGSGFEVKKGARLNIITK